MRPFTLLGDEPTAVMITASVYLLLVILGYMLAVLWIKHYLDKTQGGHMATKAIGILLAVPVGNMATRVFITFYQNFKEQEAGLLLIGFIGLLVFLCVGLVDRQSSPPTPPSSQTPTVSGTIP